KHALGLSQGLTLHAHQFGDLVVENVGESLQVRFHHCVVGIYPVLVVIEWAEHIRIQPYAQAPTGFTLLLATGSADERLHQRICLAGIGSPNEDVSTEDVTRLITARRRMDAAGVKEEMEELVPLHGAEIALRGDEPASFKVLLVR